MIAEAELLTVGADHDIPTVVEVMEVIFTPVTAGGEGCALGVSESYAVDLCWDREWEEGWGTCSGLSHQYQVKVGHNKTPRMFVL